MLLNVSGVSLTTLTVGERFNNKRYIVTVFTFIIIFLILKEISDWNTEAERK